MANYEYVIDQGVVVPDTADLLADVQSEWRSVYGEDLVVTADTPQGVEIVSETSARAAVVANNAEVANQINPNEAGGIFLDAVCALTGLEREGAKKSSIAAVTVGGVPGLPVPAGAQARSTNGDIFVMKTGVVFDSFGVGTVDFEALEYGPIPCAIGALNAVVGDVLGWETVNNTIDATIGVDQQSDDSLRTLRNVTLALQGISTVEAQISGLYLPVSQGGPGCKSVSYRENVTSAAATIDGILIRAKSVWACCYGGSNADIARSLLENKTDGADWEGAVVVPVVEPASGQTYTVRFDRPTEIVMLVRVTVRQGTDTSNPSVSIPEAVVKYANGEIPNERGLGNGVAVSPWEIAGGISYYHPRFQIVKVEITPASVIAFSTLEYPIALNKIATIIASGVSVVVL